MKLCINSLKIINFTCANARIRMRPFQLKSGEIVWCTGGNSISPPAIVLYFKLGGISLLTAF